RARSLDPLSPIINARVGSLLIFLRRFAEAETELRKVVAENPSNLFARSDFGVALAAQGKFDEAFSQFPDVIDANTGDGAGSLAWAEALAGKPDKARSILNRMEARAKERYLDPLAMAIAATAAGDKPLALNYIEEGLREHSVYLVFLKSDLKFDALRNEPRFQRVLREVETKYATSVH
ncbi:MAG: hypothetical protein ABJC63_15745, partial [Gemmatimonadales bacterium]